MGFIQFHIAFKHITINNFRFHLINRLLNRQFNTYKNTPKRTTVKSISITIVVADSKQPPKKHVHGIITMCVFCVDYKVTLSNQFHFNIIVFNCYFYRFINTITLWLRCSCLMIIKFTMIKFLLW